MNIKQFFRIARQIYKTASQPLPYLQLPDVIEKEALQCFYDYVNNDGKKGKSQIKKIGNIDIKCKHYVIDNVKQKCKDWQFCDSMKGRFNNKIDIYFCDRQRMMQQNITDCDHNIIISVLNDHQDYISLIHELQHYFQHVILDQDKLKEIEIESKQISDLYQYLLSKGQRIQQIGNCCQRFFDLYMKSYYKQLTFEQFFEKYIENSPFLNIKKLKSRRFEGYANLSMIFLLLLKNQSMQEYLKVKKYIIEYANKKLKQQKNLQKIFQSKNYFVLQNLILENKQDSNFIKMVVNLLIENKKYSLTTAIVENFQLFDILNFHEINKVDLFLMVRNLKKEQSFYYVIYRILNSKDEQLIDFFKDNVENISVDKNIVNECYKLFKEHKNKDNIK